MAQYQAELKRPTQLRLERPINTEAIEQGLDRQDLRMLRQRFEALNQQRLERVRSALPERQHIALDLLPLLFQVNHPMLPGYISASTPAGVSGYSADAEALRLAKTLARSFQMPRDKPRQRQIYGLFAMGSVGTLAHSDNSDLDIWVCHNPKLGRAALDQLHSKCRKLSDWAASLGLEAHFFLVNPEAFARGEMSGLDAESSGSSQHYLLLDEFYRSAVRLAGRDLLWWLVSPARESDYSNYCDTLLGKRFIRPSEVFDLGALEQIPAGEFAGAGIWQLYKGIDSPYKSVLKLLLLESYTSSSLPPLSLAFKAAIYRGGSDADSLDPYVLIYLRIEQYLQQRGETERLELARRCFYFKVGKALSKPPRSRRKSWQRRLLESLVAQWGWTDAELARLDRRAQWKVAEVMLERRALIAELTLSYRQLITHVRSSGASARIDPVELQILGRKLQAAFERRAGKIERINPGISSDLSEPQLQLKPQARQWQLLDRTGAILKSAAEPLELLLWAHINGLINAHTRLDYPPQLTTAPALCQYLRQWLPQSVGHTQHDDYRQPAKTRALTLIINFTEQPPDTVAIGDHSDPLNYGAQRRCLITQVDLISRNSWGEISYLHCTRFEDALLQLLRSHTDALKHIDIQCFNSGTGRALAERLELLLGELHRHLYTANQSANGRFIFRAESDWLLLQSKRGQPNLKRCASRDDLLRILAWPQREYSPIQFDSRSCSGDVLYLIANSGSLATLQVYFERLEHGSTQVYLIDERGSLFSAKMPFFNHQSLLRPLHYFLRRVLERHPFIDSNNSPNFGIKPVDFFEVCDAKLIRQRVDTDLRELPFFDVSVLLERTDAGFSPRIFLNEREFSQLALGDELYREVAAAILDRRTSREHYPIYITDLDLNQCEAEIAGDHALQTIHYLQVKSQIEQRLNQALQQL